MPRGIWRAAVFAALFLSSMPALAQDVTLTSRDGSLSVSGTLISHDGEFYRLNSDYGPLVLDAEGVICEGPACPDLTAPKAVIRIAGLPEAGAALLPGLVTTFAGAQGLQLDRPLSADGPALLTDPATGAVRAELHFQPLPQPEAEAAQKAGLADLVLTTAPSATAAGAHFLGLDALVVITAPDNPLPRLSTRDLARILSGEVKNWSAVGGPDMPLVIHGLQADHPYSAVLAARLGKAPEAGVRHDSLAALAAAVAADPWALAVTGASGTGAARVLALTDSCGFALRPDTHSVKAEDYPLVAPLALIAPRRRLPLMTRAFLESLSLPAAQSAIAAAGLTDREPQARPMAEDGTRLLNAIRGAGGKEGLAELQRLVATMETAQRLSLTFRFRDGSSALDSHSAANLADLAQRLEAGLLDGKALRLVGFSDGSGDAAANLDLSRQRAEAVRLALAQALPDLPAEGLPGIEAFGEALPIACDETSAGRHLNRRVELWLVPPG